MPEPYRATVAVAWFGVAFCAALTSDRSADIPQARAAGQYIGHRHPGPMPNQSIYFLRNALVLMDVPHEFRRLGKVAAAVEADLHSIRQQVHSSRHN